MIINFRTLKTIVVAKAKHQAEIIKVMTVLPGKYRYKQVEAALNASDLPPQTIYECLAANNETVALARFYEALQGPGSTQ